MQLNLSSALHGQWADGHTTPLAPRDAVLLAWLALEGPTPRTRLAQLLWPDSEPNAARNALRQRLFQLKRQFGENLVEGGTMLALTQQVSHDLTGSDSVLGEGDHGFGNELSAWLAHHRTARRARVYQKLVEQFEQSLQSRDFDEAVSQATALLAREPLSEDAHRCVMRVHYLAGGSGGRPVGI